MGEMKRTSVFRKVSDFTEAASEISGLQEDGC